ncbi:tetratricopeptide repeat protein [Dysgonomonas sp. 520]|uniref:tetratricopeptide repeat protein n=1 Tax=Dysgonomonas sp. 520 TaxID=2302931 RepID=UPI0013D7A980|nr:hypothetical protein [Dysgonomonas sp. 520]NDW09213.1 hypothetical protein [Dysgonomonas sp. 520]
MIENTISLKRKIYTFLSKRQLKDVFELLHNLSVNTQDWLILEKLNELEMTYKYMLSYQFEGVADPEREKVYNNILRSLFELTDDITNELLSADSPDYFYQRVRINSLRQNITIGDYRKQLIRYSEELSLTDLLDSGIEKQTKKRDIAVKRERTGADMFQEVLVSKRSEADDYEELIRFINDIELPSREKCLMVSAITLSLIHRFDARKAQALMHACRSDILVVRQRAIVGLIVILQIYDFRWQLYPECVQQLEAMSEDEGFKKSVLSIIKQLIRSRETEKITKKLTEEIIPEMMRFSSMAKRKLNMEDILGDNDFSEKNPEWKKELEDSGLANKLQEYSNLQMEGADVFHSTFANLKSFPFFNEISNWFLPYDPAYSELQSLNTNDDKDNMLYTAILNSGHMCNSDKYSFSFSLLQIPSGQREMMVTQFGAESEEMKQLQKEALSVNPNLDQEIVSNQYIQDLYRFFKLFSQRNSFKDIFTLKLNFYESKSIAPLISDIEDMKQIAAYCFDKNFFPEALTIFNKIAVIDENSDVWQRIGYCKQMQNDLHGALDAYLHADLLSPDNSWILKRIAHIYRSLKQADKAIEYYQKTAKLKNNDLSIELNIGHCYLELKEFDKALNSYFKVEMLAEKNAIKAWRPIAWTAFLMKRFDLAQQYYTRILAEKPNSHDYLNAGHTELCQNNYKQALNFYKQAVNLEDNSVDKFVEIFNEDVDMLLSVGADKNLFPLIFDQLRYEFN